MARAQARVTFWQFAAAAILLWMNIGPVSAQVAGEVEFLRGVGFAQAPGGPARILGRGLPLNQGDRITTSSGSTAIIKLADGTRMTVRPESELVLTQYQFKENAPDNSMLMELLRGGLRAITGSIAKARPDAARIQTSTATIGIRGTDFDARLCAKDCGAESARVSASARPNAVLASAKVVSVQGELYAVDASAQRRRLVEGGSLYPGDVAETAAGARAVLAFRDDTRVTLGSGTNFRVDNFIYDEQNASEGRFLVTLLKGSVRALTGLIAKANNRNVGFSTTTATIGIRGTGLDITCSGACAGEPSVGTSTGLNVYTWLGSVAVTPVGQTAVHVLQVGQGLHVTPAAVRPTTAPPPAIEGPRPDTVTVPPKLFSAAPVQDSQEGLFVYVRDGHIEVASNAGEVLHLGRGEAGYAAQTGQTARPVTVPKFIDFDRLPLPTAKNPAVATVLTEAASRPNNQCR